MASGLSGIRLCEIVLQGAVSVLSILTVWYVLIVAAGSLLLPTRAGARHAKINWWPQNHTVFICRIWDGGGLTEISHYHNSLYMSHVTNGLCKDNCSRIQQRKWNIKLSNTSALPQIQDCITGAYNVYFSWDRDKKVWMVIFEVTVCCCNE